MNDLLLLLVVVDGRVVLLLAAGYALALLRKIAASPRAGELS